MILFSELLGLRGKFSLVVSLLGLIFLGIIWQYHATLNEALASFKHLHDVLEVKKTYALNIDRYIQEARRYEKNFLLRKDLADVRQVDSSVKKLLDEATLLSRVDSGGENTASQMVAHITTYQQRFNAVVAAWKLKGLDHNDGLQGRFRKAVHELEDLAVLFHSEPLLLNFLKIRKAEHNLLVHANRPNFDTIIRLIGVFRQHISASKIAASLQVQLNQKLDIYDTIIQSVPFDNNDHHDAMESAVRDSLMSSTQQVESLLAENMVSGLLQDILQLRRHEKDYLLRGHKKYLKWVLQELEMMTSQVVSSGLSQENKTKFTHFISSYQEDFVALVDQDNRIAQLSKEMKAEADQVRELVQQNVVMTERAFELEAQHRFSAIKQDALQMLWMALVAALVGAVFVLVIIGQMSQPFRKIQEVLSRISSGELHARIEGKLGGDEMGTIAMCINTMADKVEELIVSLKERSEKIIQLSGVMEQSPVSIVVTDLAGTIKYVNPKFTQVTGYTSVEALGKNPRILKSGNTPNTLYHEMWHALARGDEWQGEIENRKKSGELYWEHASISPVRDTEGKVAHYIAMKEDITNQKRMVAELVLAKESAEAGNRAKAEFLSIMSHELRTPLNAVLGFAEILSLDALSTDQREAVVNISNAGQSLLKILDDILTLSQVDSESIQTHTAPFDRQSLIESVLEGVRNQEREKAVEINHNMADDLSRVLVGDVKSIRMVLFNLLENAVKFTPVGGYVEITVTQEHGHENGKPMVHFAVSDTGIGIPCEKQEMIFLPFTQVDSSTIRAYGGAGLGLTVCKHLVALMNGKIWLESTLGQGSVFHVLLPLAQGWLPSVAENQSGVVAEKNSNEQAVARILPMARILIVEDDRVNQLVVARVLSRLGYQTELAQHGEQALELCADESFDLILMDCMMPVMDGFAATLALRQQELERGDGSRVPIIALTALSRKNVWEKCQQVGMDDYLAKPVRMGQMQPLLEYWLTVSHEGLTLTATTGYMADRLFLEELRHDIGEEQFYQVVTLFLEALPQRLEVIRGAVKHRKIEVLGDAVHALKGAGMQLGLKTLADLAVVLLEGSQADKQKLVKRSLSMLEQEAKRVISNLHKVLDTA